jgi:hypothetical protein
VANFLTHGGVRCGHELCSIARTPAELPFLLRQLARAGGQPVRFAGNADTAQAMILPSLLEAMPEAALVVIRRPPAEVVASLHQLGLLQAEAAIRELERHVEAAARTPGALVLAYQELGSEAAARALQAHVAPGEPFDRSRWALLQGLNVQITRERMMALLRQTERRGELFSTH